MSNHDEFASHLRAHMTRLRAPVEFWSLRALSSLDTQLGVRAGVAEPVTLSADAGAMLTVIHRGGLGYAATADLSVAGLQAALDRATQWAALCAERPVTRFCPPEGAQSQGRFASPDLDAPLPATAPWLDLLAAEDAAAGRDTRIVDRHASLWVSEVISLLLTNQGGDIEQRHRYMVPNLRATAAVAGEVQARSLAGQYNGYCLQGGLGVIERSGFVGCGARIADEALQLAMAPDAPSGCMDLLVMPDQMMLQIHESIGHPLELDRILGDERNFAGTSFVSLDMFGSYRYGSELLNVSVDPTHHEQFASYAFDDGGQPTRKVMLIENGVLMRPLGSDLSARRARELGYAFEGVANLRASHWSRPPIDRMANLNVEPGTSSLDDMIASIDNGLLVRTNVSWSIDDSRNKFQFGCEWGERIEGGRITGVVRNPNYRGVSAHFWRNLRAVGDASTFEIMGTPFCGKGEPAQIVRVGHASPACLFADVNVFGSAA